MNQRRFGITFALAGAAILVFFGGCADSETIIVGEVSFLNPSTNARTFPPAGHSGALDDDVCYARLVDTDGTGTVIWESEAYPVTFLDSYVYDPDDSNNQNTTPDDGVHIKTFVITLTDTQLAAATMPLRLEGYLYDAAVAAPIDPSTDTEMYSYYDLNGDGDPGWHTSQTVLEGSTIQAALFITVPFP